jgi:histidyl-tRNA synthetase
MSRIETPKAIRGTQDMLGDQAERFHHVVAAFDKVRRLYGFRRVEVPVFEATAVFARSLGETTDVVSKEMYTFPDQGGDSLTLRPEFTAGIARAYLTEGWQQYIPLKVATHGPVFRYERPQKGRFRQFHQVDAEVIGSPEPAADVELLVFADHLLRELGVSGDVTLKLNTLGDAASRDAWRAALIKHFEAHRGDLSPESVQRLAKNPLRILDSKDPRDRPAVDAAPEMVLSAEAGNFFGKVREGLTAAGVAYELCPHLVRGLDYYRHTAFEFVTDRLGAQGTVLAGGRYDGLIESLGGPATPAVGWAAGIERLAMLEGPWLPFRSVVVVVESDSSDLNKIGDILVQRLRRTGMPTQVVNSGNVRKRYDRATKIGSDYLIILTEDPDAQLHVGKLRIKRTIRDLSKARGAIFKSLNQYLHSEFGIEKATLKRLVAAGGEVNLPRPK